MRKPLCKSIYLFILFACLGLANHSFAKKDSDILAQIGKKYLSVGEFNKRYEQNASLSPQNVPDKKEVLNNIIYFELATQEARKIKLDKSSKVKDQIDILLYQELVKQKIQPKIDKLKVSKAELISYYKLNPLIRTKHIVFLTRPESSKETHAALRKKAEKIRQRAIKNPNSFSDLAKEYSEGPSAKLGGDVDWGARHKLLTQYYEAALMLKETNKISDVVKTPYGYHIIQLKGIRPYEEIDSVYKNYIVRMIKEQRGKNVYDEYFANLKKSTTVKINESLL